jgi:glutamate-5-semialdehyde dehydrogenase
LTLTEERLRDVASGVEAVAALPDPIGQIEDMRTLPNGLLRGRMSVPFGVIGAIYENRQNRPNVTVDIASLCFKAGSATILRGGAVALRTNVAIGAALRQALVAHRVTTDAIQILESTDRQVIHDLLAARQYIDLMVPRGGAELIRLVEEQATMPVLIGGVGVCHLFVDRAAELDKAVAIVLNSKTRRFSVCNALDTLLVHAAIAPRVLPAIHASLRAKGVTFHCDDEALSILGGRDGVVPAEGVDFGREWLSLDLSVKVCPSYDDAIEFIYEHGSGHSDGIITEDYSLALRFVRDVDTAVCYVNASTQFTDGAQFGMGAEIIDSTQKMHARGPVGLREICTYKWVVLGTGQTRV